LLVALATAPSNAPAQAPQCTTGRILGASPAANATFQVCPPSLHADPAMVALVERMNPLAEENADSRKLVERLVQALGRTSTEFSDEQLRTLANSVADRLGASAGAIFDDANLSRSAWIAADL
jgi:hypothetical protein